MSGFKKAKCEQAAIKAMVYGPAGAGKTLTSLLIAEGLAKHTGTRVAFVDTETGTSFYSQDVPERKIHPKAFDFDVLHTKSLTETLAEVRKLKPTEHGVLVIDSLTHLWEAAQNAYRGSRNRAGQIPFHAWGGIKKPYKELMGHLLNSTQHFVVCGRQGNDYKNDEDTGELVVQGFKIKAEGETAYEPHLIIRMEVQRPGKRGGESRHLAVIEKDRSGKIMGQVIESPTFETLAAPILALLGDTQIQIPNDDAAANQDADTLAKQDRDKHVQSNTLAKVLFAEMALATQAEDPAAVLNSIGERIRVAKAANRLSKWDLGQLRGAYEAAIAGKDFPSYRPEGGDAE